MTTLRAWWGPVIRKTGASKIESELQKALVGFSRVVDGIFGKVEAALLRDAGARKVTVTWSQEGGDSFRLFAVVYGAVDVDVVKRVIGGLGLRLGSGDIVTKMDRGEMVVVVKTTLYV